MEKSSPSSSYFTPNADAASFKGHNNPTPSDNFSELQARIRRLEDSIASLQDQSLLEERIATRLQQGRLQKNEHTASIAAVKTGVEILTPNQVEDVVEVPSWNPLVAGKWFFSEIVPELRAMACMFFDPRYRLGAWNKAVPAGLFLMIVLSGYWVPFSSLPVVGSLIDSIIMLGLGYFLIKILSAESRRYRQLAPGLPRSLRLGPDFKQD